MIRSLIPVAAFGILALGVASGGCGSKEEKAAPVTPESSAAKAQQYRNTYGTGGGGQGGGAAAPAPPGPAPGAPR